MSDWREILLFPVGRVTTTVILGYRFIQAASAPHVIAVRWSLGCQATIILKIVACALPASFAPPFNKCHVPETKRNSHHRQLPIHAHSKTRAKTILCLPVVEEPSISQIYIPLHLAQTESASSAESPLNQFGIGSFDSCQICRTSPTITPLRPSRQTLQALDQGWRMQRT